VNAVVTTREFQLGLTGNAALANLCGPLDENLRLIESRLGLQIRRRGAQFRAQGERAIAAEALLRRLAIIAQTAPVSSADVHLGLVEQTMMTPLPRRVPRPARRARLQKAAPTPCMKLRAATIRWWCVRHAGRFVRAACTSAVTWPTSASAT
jgi:phosphate starvation-inducible protein PhoH